MQFKKLLEDDDAVSPVIGVILMVAITVILAAVIGTFVLGLGDQVQQTSPTAQFSFDFSEGTADNADATLDITHDGGDGIAVGQISASADSTSVTTSDCSGSSWGSESTTVTAGDTCQVTESADGALAGSTVRVLWQSSGGDRSSTLADWEGPDA